MMMDHKTIGDVEENNVGFEGKNVGLEESNVILEAGNKDHHTEIEARGLRGSNYWRKASEIKNRLVYGLTSGTVDDKSVSNVGQKGARVATLDVFRGLTVAIMILVDDAGSYWPKINHSPWNGCTLADLVMPFFLFIVGVAIALAFKRVPNRGAAVKRVTGRTLKLLFWGIILQGGYSQAPDVLAYGVDMKLIRWCGILQRIALSYFIVSLVEIAISNSDGWKLPEGRFEIFKLYKWHWLVAFICFFVYHSVVYGLYVPDWHYIPVDGDGKTSYIVKCGVKAHFGAACNAVGYVDRQVWGIHHLYGIPEFRRAQSCSLDSPADGPAPPNAPSWCLAPFEPEGFMSSISAILSCILGLHYGHVLIHFKDHKKRLVHWISIGIVLILLGMTLHFSDGIPINKQLYSFSYVCFTGGAAGLLFSALYILIDAYKIRMPTILFEWMGMNAMLVFAGGAQGLLGGFVNGFYYKSQDNNLTHWIEKHLFIKVWHSVRVGFLMYVLFAEILFWGILCGFLHYIGWYWKL
ncbi:hypothetical protein O6H91_20G042500 [Diphasiastrum complanatum]|uniref:Uncharacterized protein n=1 Tax=Diphasiastrum complanatum TaxID=34168 RepID=A0ACC2APQ1_DIPCM|nr:hypothetical protein O6H91_20G042500 [Diphasiastrum complanatum]